VVQRWAMHTPLCPGGGGARHCPCHSAAHCQHMKRQPSLVSVVVMVIVAIAVAVPIAIAVTVSVATMAIAVGHCRRSHRRPSLLSLPLPIIVAVSIADAIAIAIAVSHYPHPPHWSSPLPLSSAIAIGVTVGHPQCHRHCRHLHNCYCHLNNLSK
jgi:hypothetical protein